MVWLKHTKICTGSDEEIQEFGVDQLGQFPGKPAAVRRNAAANRMTFICVPASTYSIGSPFGAAKKIAQRESCLPYGAELVPPPRRKKTVGRPTELSS